jgi:hypothetical protein
MQKTANMSEAELKLLSHEEVCKVRYEQIHARLKRLEQILIGTAGFIIITLLTLVLKWVLYIP